MGSLFAALAPLLTTVGSLAATAISIKALFASDNATANATQVAAQQQGVLNAITPSVVNQLQNRGITLPPGSEQDYVRAAISGQLPSTQLNPVVPLAIAGLGLFILLKE